MPKKRGRPREQYRRSRGRPQIDKPPKDLKPRGRPRIINQPNDPKTRGRPNIERTPKAPQKKEGNQNQKVYQLKRRPRGRPRIYREGTIGRPEDIDYF